MRRFSEKCNVASWPRPRAMGGNAILWLAYFFLERLNTFFLRRRLTDCNVKCLAAHVTFLSPHLLLLALLLALTSWLASHSLYSKWNGRADSAARGLSRAKYSEVKSDSNLSRWRCEKFAMQIHKESLGDRRTGRLVAFWAYTTWRKKKGEENKIKIKRKENAFRSVGKWNRMNKGIKRGCQLTANEGHWGIGGHTDRQSQIKVSFENCPTSYS